MRILILGLFGLLLLAPPAFSQTASYGGCMVRSDLTVLEVIEGACAPRVVKVLAEHLDIACSPELREEAATLSMAAATEQGLAPEAAARLKVLEAVCCADAGGASKRRPRRPRIRIRMICLLRQVRLRMAKLPLKEN